MDEDVSSTQLLHGYQYHRFRELYSERKAATSMVASATPASNNGEADAGALTAIAALRSAHGHRQLPGLEKLVASVQCTAARDVASAHNGNRAREAQRTNKAARDASTSVSNSVLSVIMKLRGSSTAVTPQDLVPHDGVTAETWNAVDAESDDDVEWSGPQQHHANLHPSIELVIAAAGPHAKAPWLRAVQRAAPRLEGESREHSGELGASDPDEHMWHVRDRSAFGNIGPVPDATTDTVGAASTPQPASEAGIGDAFMRSNAQEERLRARIKEHRRKAREALWKKITYGASSKGVADAQQRLKANSLGKKGLPSRSSRLLSPLQLSRQQAGGYITSFRSNASAPDANSGDFAPRLIGDASFGAFEGPRRVGSLLVSPSSVDGVGAEMPVATRAMTKLERVVSVGEMPSKHDVVAALSAAKEHFSQVPLRSVLPVAPVVAPFGDFGSDAVEDAGGAVTPSPPIERTHAERLVETGLHAALLARVAMSVSPADYRLASALRTARKYLRDGDSLQVRAWGITDITDTPSPMHMQPTGTSRFPAKWMIVSGDRRPLEVTVAIAWDPFPSLLEDPSPNVATFEYVVAQPGERLLQDAWTSLRLTFLNAAEEMARLHVAEQQWSEREAIMRHFRPLLCVVIDVPSAYRQSYFDTNATLLRHLLATHAPLPLRRRFQGAVVHAMETSAMQRVAAARCFQWIAWLARRKKGRKDGTAAAAAAAAAEASPAPGDRPGGNAARATAVQLLQLTSRSRLQDAFSNWHVWSAQCRRRRCLDNVERAERAKPAVRMHSETLRCATALHEGLVTALDELGIGGHSVTIVGHGSGGMLACAVAAILNREADVYENAPSAHSVITIGSPRLTLEDPSAMFVALSLDAVCFGCAGDPALHLPLTYSPLSAGIFTFGAPGLPVECVAASQMLPVPFAAHEHWKLNSVDAYIVRFIECGEAVCRDPWPGELPSVVPSELAAERFMLTVASETLRRGSSAVKHGFTPNFVAVLQQIHASLALRGSSRVNRTAVIAATLLMIPPQPICVLQHRVPQGRRGLVDFPAFVEWLWSEHCACPAFVTSFLASLRWTWDEALGAFAQRGAVKLPSAPAVDPFLPLVARDEQGHGWTIAPAARAALEHAFTHYSRVIPPSPFDVRCSGAPVASYNSLVLFLQHSGWTHPCTATHVVDALLTLLERRHVQRPRSQLMNFGGSLTLDGFVAFVALLVDWFGEAYMLERLWVLGYNGLFQHSITRGALENIYARGGRYEWSAEDRWLTRLRHEEEREFNEWVTEYIDRTQREKLRAAQASSFRKIQSLRGAQQQHQQQHQQQGEAPPSRDDTTHSCDGGSKRRPMARTPQPGSVQALYGATPQLQSWTATGDNSRSRLRKVDDSNEVFTGAVETSVGLRLNGPLNRLARVNRRRALPKLSHQPHVNAPDRMDNLYTRCGVIHLVNSVQRVLLRLDNCECDGNAEQSAIAPPHVRTATSRAAPTS